MLFDNMSNEEVAGVVEHWAIMAELTSSKESVLSSDQLFFIVGRLRQMSDDDVEALVDETREQTLSNARQLVRKRMEALDEIIDDLRQLSERMDNDIDHEFDLENL